ncbi:MAG: asparagine synthase (glutamine-hydrolyzing) [Bryobacteraceae bacterium]
MCGICGKLTFEQDDEVSPALVSAMLSTITHRGPDGEGIHVSPQVGLGHRRLAIIDLSGGAQPLSNEDGTVWISFNGEIYNYLELRENLLRRGHQFRTKSDTEVIVHLYEEMGEACVEKLRGMFAFAIWDARQRILLLARDRVGIKPLYYHLNDRSLVFGSEIKAILADPEVNAELRPEMIDRFLTFFYMPGEDTLLRNIQKLGPACYMVVKDGRATIRKYWDLNFSPADRTFRDASDELEAILEESVRLHMISDVPVGFLLSGGVDSTAVLGFAAGKTDHPLSSFTLGFDAPGIIDERPYAQLAAKAYGSEHHELTITSGQFRDFLPKYVWHMEEPVCEPPAIALYYVSKLAKDHVKVLLSGEGGDEAFAGYQNYRSLLWMERLKNVLGPLRSASSSAVGGVNRLLKNGKLAKFGPLLDIPLDQYYYGRTSGPLAYFNGHNRDNLYTTQFARDTNKSQSLKVVADYLINTAGFDTLSKMLYVDTKTWLTDDLLLKADKMTMANSVELRVPLLDHKLLEFAASLPSKFKIHGFTTKYIAKRVLEKRVPEPIIKRRKAGFPVPYGAWLRTEMKEWLFDLLLDPQTINRGYFNRSAVENLLTESAGSGSHSKELFSLATLELWHRTFLQQPKTADLSGSDAGGLDRSPVTAQ